MPESDCVGEGRICGMKDPDRYGFFMFWSAAIHTWTVADWCLRNAIEVHVGTSIRSINPRSAIVATHGHRNDVEFVREPAEIRKNMCSFSLRVSSLQMSYPAIMRGL